jgi:membrane-bound lytic murein transglycosylase A
MNIKKKLLSLLLLIFTLPCFAAVYFLPQTYKDLPNWHSTSIPKTALNALKASCQRNLMLYPYYFQTNFDIRGQLSWMISCEAVLQIPANASSATIRKTLEIYFRPYLAVHNFSSQGLFTGYYLPEIKGSLTPSKYYHVPVYGMPKKTWNMPCREQINTIPELPGATVLAWVHNSIDLYFMQVQGSGKITLPSGKILLLGYAGQNGYPYYPIARFIRDIGATKPKGMASITIQEWLNYHPRLAVNIMDIDASYVFFKVLNTPEPLGAERIPLTPGHSLAVDTGYIPLGSPIWLSSFYPSATDPKSHDAAFSTFMVAQDTGGAINGPVRGDVYWGSGPRAKYLASHLQSPGEYWVLLPTALNVGIMNDEATFNEF